MDYLSIHSKDPLTKPELVEHLVKSMDLEKYAEKFRIKRSGKDLNDTYWAFGKVHGLENIAFVDPERLAAAKGNPVAIQELINEINPEDVPGFASQEELLAAR